GTCGPPGVPAERAQHFAPDRLQALLRSREVPPRTLELRSELLVPAGAQPRGVLLVRAPPDLAHEAPEALGHAGRLELVAEHRGEREGQRRTAVEQVEQRQVAAGD